MIVTHPFNLLVAFILVFGLGEMNSGPSYKRKIIAVGFIIGLLIANIIAMFA